MFLLDCRVAIAWPDPERKGAGNGYKSGFGLGHSYTAVRSKLPSEIAGCSDLWPVLPISLKVFLLSSRHGGVLRCQVANEDNLILLVVVNEFVGGSFRHDNAEPAGTNSFLIPDCHVRNSLA